MSVLHVGLAKLSLATFLKSIIATLSSEASNEDNVAIIDFKKVARESNIGSADLSNLYQLLIHILRKLKCLAEDDVEMLKGELLQKMSEYDSPKDEDEPQNIGDRDNFGYSFRSRGSPKHITHR